MNIKIKVLGTGCSKCNTLTQIVEEVVRQNRLDATVQKIEDIEELMQYNIISIPAIVVNEQLVSKGRVPSYDEVLELIRAHSKDIESPCCNSDSCCN